MNRRTAIRAVAAAIGAFNVILGLWAFLHPESFFERIAAFPPYNEHLLHDIGAFQTGLGAVLLFAFVWADALLVVLAGAGVGFILHFASHLVDRDLGGRVTDPVSVGLLALVVVLAAIWQAQGPEGRADESPTDEPPPAREPEPPSDADREGAD